MSSMVGRDPHHKYPMHTEIAKLILSDQRQFRSPSIQLPPTQRIPYRTVIDQFSAWLQDENIEHDYKDEFFLLNRENMAIRFIPFAPMKHKWELVQKAEALVGLGFKVIQYFQDEWITNPYFIKSGILHQYAKQPSKERAKAYRLSKINDPDLEASFCSVNHNMPVRAWRDHCYAAHTKDGILGGMIWVKLKNDHLLDIVQFCTDLRRPRIFGLYTRMLYYVVKDLQFEGTIFTLSNARLGKGRLYEAVGFEHSHLIPPRCFVSDGHSRVLQRRAKVPEGCFKMWDCGLDVWHAPSEKFTKK